jgi:hypothetical protein
LCRNVILVLLVKPEYRHLFYTTETAVQYIRAEHSSAETDEIRMHIFAYNEVKWRSYRGEVRDFTLANWARWHDERPAWFTEEVIQRVPDEFIPVAALVALNAAAHGGKRRRSSVGLASSVRESLRDSLRASVRSDSARFI